MVRQHGYIQTGDAETSRALNRLAREQLKRKLLADILTDMTVCEIEGWNKIEFLDELIEMLTDVRTRKKTELEVIKMSRPNLTIERKPIDFIPREYNKRAIGKRISQRMRELDYTQMQVAEAIDASESNMYSWCSGRSTPSVRYLMELARLLETTADWLVFGDRTV